jgi:hypothetical protein
MKCRQYDTDPTAPHPIYPNAYIDVQINLCKVELRLGIMRSLDSVLDLRGYVHAAI